MKRKVYIETSVISYLTARPSRDLVVAAHQQITTDWWENSLPRYKAFISAIVLDEISRGDTAAVQSRLEKIATFHVLEVLPEIRDLSNHYFSALDIPEKARADSYHLAIASWHGMDFGVSWNCAHIVNGRVKILVEEINARRGIRTPIICTPEELMEG